MRMRAVLALAAVTILLVSCLAGPASSTTAAPAGFAAGVWHGLLAPFTLIASFLTPFIRMYETANVGPQYDLGFLIGFLALLSLPITLHRLRRR